MRVLVRTCQLVVCSIHSSHQDAKEITLIYLTSELIHNQLEMASLLHHSSRPLFRHALVNRKSTYPVTPTQFTLEKVKRCLSSAANQTEELLFERGNDQFTLIRSGLGFSSFHTAYWIWYTTDFVPTVNAANIPELYVDPMLGITGTLFAAGLQLLFFAWPKRLVSRLTYRPSRDIGGQIVPAQFCVYTHAILGVVPATVPSAVIPVTNDKGHSLIDPSTHEAKEVLANFSDQLQNYRGYLRIRNPKMSWPPLVLDFRDSSKIPHPDRLLQALLNPKQFVAMDQTENYERRYVPLGQTRESRLRKITKQRQKHQKRR